MTIGVIREKKPGEARVAIVPDSVKKIAQWKEIKIIIENGAGEKSGYPDDLYREAGATLESSEQSLLSQSDIVLMVNRPDSILVEQMKKGSALICQLDPFNEKELLKKLADKGVLAVSLEMIPRSTIAQKMDVLSSQASIAGYMAVVKASTLLGKVFPMMMTPAGTISPSKVFIIGAGVAGLQAVATAKRLGANVSAFDTRPVVEEQVQSLGGKFIKIDLGETGQTKDGYANALTEEQLQKQRDLMAKVCSQSDVVITTAKLFGRKAPVIITSQMVESMKPGSVIIDLAVDSGGNVEGSEPGEIVEVKGIKILGYGNAEGDAAFHASQMFSGNVLAFLETFLDKATGQIDLLQDHEILENCIITKEGAVVHERFKEEG